MIKQLSSKDDAGLIAFLQTVAPEQVPFVEGHYFKHGENIAFGCFDGQSLIACIRYCIQEIGVEQKTPPIRLDEQILTEAKINAFAVAVTHRNQGIGKRLQIAAIQDATQRGCSQLSSYSTFERVENYAVKIRLGFCVQPEIQPDGTMGCFFLMKLPASDRNLLE